MLLNDEGAAKVRELAREHDPVQFGRKVEELAASKRPAEVQDAHEAIRARRHLRLMHGPRGNRIEGLLDPVAGHRFRLALEAASARPGKDDTRTAGQRAADALEAISVAILEEGKLSPAPHVPTQVMITMTEQTFLDAQEHLALATHRPADRDRQPPTDHAAGERAERPFPQIRAQDGPLLPPADLGQLLCGSTVGRLVVAGDAVPLNAGRTQRTFKGMLRRVVELRDQHCAWPECYQVARYCKVHHLDWWDSDCGETDVGRGVLVCEFHHHELHTHDFDLVPQPRQGPQLLPGDTEYVPPEYRLVPRSETVGDRRTRLARRMRRIREARLTEGREAAGQLVGKRDAAGPLVGKRDTAGPLVGKRDTAGPLVGKRDTAGPLTGRREVAGQLTGKREAAS